VIGGLLHIIVAEVYEHKHNSRKHEKNDLREAGQSSPREADPYPVASVYCSLLTEIAHRGEKERNHSRIQIH